MNRLSSRLPFVLALVLGLAGLSSNFALAQSSYRSPRTWIDDDFGPPADNFNNNSGRGTYDSGRRPFRNDLRNPGGAGSRDPSNWFPDDPQNQPASFSDDRRYQRPFTPSWNDDTAPQSRPFLRSSAPDFRSPVEDLPSPPFRRSQPRDFSNDDSYVPRSAPQSRQEFNRQDFGRKEFDRSDMNSAPSRTWDQWTPPANNKPSAHPQPTVAEKISARYQDPRVLRVLQQITPQSGDAFYVETAQLIDSRHIAPTSYQQRVQSAIQHLSIALETPSFQKAIGITNRSDVPGLEQELAAYGRQVQVQNLQQAIGSMHEVGNMFAHYLNVNPAVVSLAYVYGALDTLDQYSMFIAPEKSGSTSLGLKENMVGIGVEIEACPQGVKIVKALGGGPAADATLKRGDIITGVDNRSIAGLDLNQVADLLGGTAGTPVKLDLQRDSKVGEVTLVRRPFKVLSISDVHMESNGVGYIKLDQFAESSSKEMDAALYKLNDQGMQSLILDLRGNPGGLLTTAIELADKFLPSGTIVSTRGRTQADNSQETAQYPHTWKVPLVVLIDHDSASAAEIFAAAIQENRRGVIVGETSYGKGTVQTLFPLESISGALRLTTAKFYSPEGREMAGVGVTPDVRVTSNGRLGNGPDAALQKALQTARDPRLLDMAKSLARTGKTDLKVFRVDA